MAMGRPKKPIVLTTGQRDELEAMERSQSLRGELVSRARVILLCASGKTNQEIGKLMMMNGATVGKWRQRFLKSGISGLHDGLRTGRPRLTTTIASPARSARTGKQ
jgi:transposase